jgi:general stress protein 26
MLVTMKQQATLEQAAPGGSAQAADEHLLKLVRSFETATLVTERRTGGLHGRPMVISAVDDEATLWFFSNINSTKIAELAEDARAMLTFQSALQFVALSGQVELLSDATLAARLWKESYRVWFHGSSDPDIVLLKFTTFDAEYWDYSGVQGLKYALQSLRAYVTGRNMSARDTRPHAKLDFSRLTTSRR